MAKIAKDAGYVHVHLEDGGTVVLAPGDDVPSGAKVPDHVLEGKRQHAEQTGDEPVPGPGQFISSEAHAKNAQKQADSAARKAANKAALEAAKAAKEAEEKAAEEQAAAEAEAAKSGGQ